MRTVFADFAPAGQLREICWAESAILLVALHAALLKVCEFVQLEQSILKLSMRRCYKATTVQ